MLRSHVASPTCSTTMSTPRLPVRRRISAGKSWVVVVHHLGRPNLPGARQLVIRARGGEHARPMKPGNLNRRLSCPAAGAEHEHVIVRLHPGPRDEHVPRGEKRQRKRRGFDKADRIGQRDQIAERHAHELGVAAVALRSEHVVTGAQWSRPATQASQ